MFFYLEIKTVLTRPIRRIWQVIFIWVVFYSPLKSQCNPEYIHFDAVPENVNIIGGDSCFYVPDIQVLDSMIANNQLVYNSPLELGTQTWFNGRLKILIAGLYGNTSGVNDTIFSLPDNIGNWDHLSSLYLEWNKIEYLPVGFSQLSSLQSLYLSNNRLQELPGDFGNLSNLYYLDVGYNKLDSLPASFCNLSNLTYFWAFNNTLISLPDCICSLNLNWNDTDGAFFPYFAIGGNQLCDQLPDCIATSEHLHTSLDQFYYSFMVTDSQDCSGTYSDLLNYVPFQVGNRWQYEGFEFYGDSAWSMGLVESQVITDTIMPNGRKYSFIDHIPLFGDTFARVDSSNQILYYYIEVSGDEDCSNHEWDFIDFSFLDSIAWNDCMNQLADIQSFELFIESINDTFPSIVVDHWGSETQTVFSENIGISSISYSLGLSGIYYKLIAATVDGVQYGEYASINNHPVLPDDIMLFQNYPNPFNATTTIRFSVKVEGVVSLQVIDIRGRLVETLVNSHLMSGEYEVVWNGESRPSGIYYIQIVSGSSTDFKKIILLK